MATGEHLAAASTAGLLTLVFTNPITVVKTRLCLQERPRANMDTSRHYTGMLDAFLKIVKYEGCSGLYKGFIPGLFGVVHGAIQFMAYEDLKNRYNNYYNKVNRRGQLGSHLISLLQPIDSPISPYMYLTFAAISKLLAALSTYPYQVG